MWSINNPDLDAPGAVYSNDVPGDERSAVALATLRCIDDATQHLSRELRDAVTDRFERAKARARAASPMLASVLLLCPLLALGIQMLASARRDRLECEQEFQECLDEQQAALSEGGVLDQSSLAPCPLLVRVPSLVGGPDLACDLATSRSVLGMAAWRWMLFLGLFWPIQIAALVAMQMALLLVDCYCKIAGKVPRLYTHGVAPALANFVRAISWIALWFALTEKPRQWAKDAVQWNADASGSSAYGDPGSYVDSESAGEVWPPVFTRVHAIAWRLLVMWAVFAGARALAKIAGRVLAVRFHYAGHDSETARTHTRLLSALTAPRNVPVEAEVSVLAADKKKFARVSGEDSVWWAALRMLERPGAWMMHSDSTESRESTEDSVQGDVFELRELVSRRLGEYFASKFDTDVVSVLASARSDACTSSRTINHRTRCCCSSNLCSKGSPRDLFSDPADSAKTTAKRLAVLVFLNVADFASDSPDEPSTTILSIVRPSTPADSDTLHDHLWTLMDWPHVSKGRASAHATNSAITAVSATIASLAHQIARIHRDSACIHRVLYAHAQVIAETEGAIWSVLCLISTLAGLALFNPASLTHVWTGLSAVMVAICFVFGQSARQLYESCVFLFWTKPFNVGDIIWINDNRVVVTEIHLRFVRVVRDNGLNTVIPTHDITTSQVVNETRSTSIWNSVEFDADTAITLAQCAVVADHVKAAISKHAGVLAGEYCVNLVPSVSNAEKVMLRVSFTRYPSSVHELMKDDARTYIVDAVCGGMRSVGIKFTTVIRMGGTDK